MSKDKVLQESYTERVMREERERAEQESAALKEGTAEGNEDED